MLGMHASNDEKRYRGTCVPSHPFMILRGERVCRYRLHRRVFGLRARSGGKFNFVDLLRSTWPDTLAYVLSPLSTGEHLRIFNLR
jgi:hypothetical protein